MALNFYCLDLETNGLVFTNNFHEICELSILRATDRVQLSRQVKIDRPENSSFDALRITNKTIEDLKKGISKQQLIQEVEMFLAEDGTTAEHRCLIGHNIINFDRKFLWQLWSYYNKSFPFSLYLDTMNMSKAYIKKMGMKGQKSNLGAACDLLGVEKRAGAHAAKVDTRNCYLLWQKLIEVVDYLEHIKRIPHSTDDDQEY
jgi:DNA polymerase III alpha subunit (gram-positive type)